MLVHGREHLLQVGVASRRKERRIGNRHLNAIERSASWQRYAVSEGGRRMLSSGGARSSQRKRHQTRNFLRRLRDGLVGFGWLSKLLRER